MFEAGVHGKINHQWTGPHSTEALHVEERVSVEQQKGCIKKNMRSSNLILRVWTYTVIWYTSLYAMWLGLC